MAQCPECGDSVSEEGYCLRCFSSAMAETLQAQLPATPATVDALFPDLSDIKLAKRGGMSAIYHARQVEDGEPVALKILSHQLGRDFGRERLVEEIGALMALDHPHIVKVHHGGVTQGGDGYLILDLVQGHNLTETQRNCPLSDSQVFKLATTLTETLAYVHDQGFVHSDITPGNVLLDENDHLYLLDFGLVYVLDAHQARQAMGTPPFAAPEQRLGKPLDPRTDVYSLGVLIYNLLTRHMPGDGAMPHLKDSWRQFLQPALQHDPGDRYQSMPDMLKAMPSLD